MNKSRRLGRLIAATTTASVAPHPRAGGNRPGDRRVLRLQHHRLPRLP
ncbi:hypothetical protein QP028_14850 [Corynebacterium suedekumii]|nr:hypothetical protein QP028_14850 [Corynebacterium suedekumii]